MAAVARAMFPARTVMYGIALDSPVIAPRENNLMDTAVCSVQVGRNGLTGSDVGVPKATSI